MSEESSETPPAADLAARSSLYAEFLAEREEILRHKWIESEKAGCDIGFERALLDWIRKHREGWRAARRQQSPAPGTTPSATAAFVAEMASSNASLREIGRAHV